MCPILTFWHAKVAEYPNRNRKNMQNATKKQTFDAHQNQYIIGVYENHYKNSKNKLQKLYSFLLVIKDSKNGSAAVGLSKKAKAISP